MAQDQNFSLDSPVFIFYFVVVVLEKSPMNEFLIDCSFKSNSIAPKLDQLILRYMPHSAGSWPSAMPHSA
jgi:hypothetical protein